MTTQVMAATTTSAGALAQGLQYGLIVGGMVVIGALVAPTLLTRRPPRATPGPPYDEHALRVAALRGRIAGGTLAAAVPPAPVLRPARIGARTDLPVAVVASAAAAGVHAAVAPPHLGAGLATGTFLLLCALAQLTWAALVLRGSSAGLLVAGVVGNLAVLTLWLASRTVGVPGHAVEPFGPWDLACAGWELVVVGACLVRLGRGPAVDRVAPWQAWSTSTLVLLGGSAFTLLVLAFTGASA